MTTRSLRSAAEVLVDQLVLHGSKRAFCVPGESYLPVLDALYARQSDIELTVNRHESGASFMAEAWGKLTGTPGICFVTRGPGATNASIGIHTAYQDSTPLILFIGQVGSDFMEREAFQEVDYRRMFGQFAKWVAQIDRADRVPEFIARAYHVATSGRQGPVVLALPEDMLLERVDVADAKPYQALQAEFGAAPLAKLKQLLEQAERPFVILGGSGWTADAARLLEQFATRWSLPVGCSFRRQDLFDNRHACYAGDVGIGINPRLAARIRAADVVIALGARLGEMTSSGYTLFDVPVPRQTLVHIHPDADELGRVYQPTLAIQAGMVQSAEALASLELSNRASWAAATSSARADYLAWQTEPAIFSQRPQSLNLWCVVEMLFKTLPPNALLANGAGNFATWGHRFRQYPGISSGYRTQLAPTSGAMGYGVPAGISAQIFDKTRPVVVLAGDGDFMMTGQELATAVSERAGVLFIVVNNGMYGTIRMHQERQYPSRVHGTALGNPDFVRLAEAYGAFGARVEQISEFGTALNHALAWTKDNSLPALIELMADPEVITPSATIQSLRARD
jgi:acetolactate synthase-1/2/3 large subunit